MPPKRDNAAASPAPSCNAISALKKRVASLEQQAKKRDLRAVAIQKKDLLNAEMKSYSDNIYFKGMKLKYAIKDLDMHLLRSLAST